jgi:hypothetical protein
MKALMERLEGQLMVRSQHTLPGGLRRSSQQHLRQPAP